MNNESMRSEKRVTPFILLGVLVLLCWLLQSAPGGFLPLFHVSPVLLPILVAAIGMAYGETVGALYGLAAGVLMDLYTIPSLGFHAVLLTAVGIVCGLAVKHFLMQHLAAALVLAGTVAVAYFVLYWLVFKVIAGGGGALYYLVRFSLPAAVYSGLWGLVFCPLTRWIRRIGIGG